MKYTVDYFIDKFESIPEEKWCTATLRNSKGQMCANGLCGVTCVPTEEANALADTLSVLTLTKFKWVWLYGGKIFDVTSIINDGLVEEYKQPTPKQRILAALYDVRARQSDNTITSHLQSEGFSKAFIEWFEEDQVEYSVYNRERFILGRSRKLLSKSQMLEVFNNEMQEV